MTVGRLRNQVTYVIEGVLGKEDHFMGAWAYVKGMKHNVLIFLRLIAV